MKILTSFLIGVTVYGFAFGLVYKIAKEVFNKDVS